MPLLAGTKIGTYEVLAPLGAGGMGEVYRARDARLQRDVALKVLPAAFAGDVQRMARFEREARMLASLNHPNIAAIYGLEESGPIRALVMELVEGPTLADRIRSGAIPLDEALPIAKQIAEAVEYAHDNNVIHRDLKPANIKVKADSTVKVLDFGLAKAMSDDLAEIDMANSPTLSMAATQQGIILGTAAYMSPEQAKGKSVDRRTDVWAFGCVLYEMLTGQQPFGGETIADTLAHVITKNVPLDSIAQGVPPAVETLLKRCLTKDVRRRLSSMSEARIAIEDALSGAAGDATGVRERSLGSPDVKRRDDPSYKIFAAISAVLLVTLAGLAFVHFREKPAVARVITRFNIGLRPGELIQWSNGGLAISPDGRYVAYSSLLPGGTRQLYLHPMDGAETISFPGTDNASAISFSPDGAWIAFTAAAQLSKVPVTGGKPTRLCDRKSFNTATWGPDGYIYFGETLSETQSAETRLMRVAAAGGACETIATLPVKPGEQGVRWPEVTPDGAAVLFVVNGTLGAFSDDATIMAQSLRTGERKTLIQGGTSPHYLADGHLVYGQGGKLMAVPFDPRRLAITGAAVPVLDDVAQGTGGYSAYGISSQGALVYINGGETGARTKKTLNWVDRKGFGQPIRDEGHVFGGPHLSPDGRTLAITNGDAAPGYDIWTSDLSRSTLTRLTFVKTGEQAVDGMWTTDGKRVIYSLSYPKAETTRTGAFRIMWRPADGTGAEEELVSAGDPVTPLSCSPDGQLLVYQVFPRAKGYWSLFAVPLMGEHKARPLIEASFDNMSAQVSPDGRWIAYVSDESGHPEVFVRPFPGLSGKWQVSSTGGREPRWSRDGRHLFYRNGTIMMETDIQTQSGFAASTPRSLFDQPYSGGTEYDGSYDVAPDGQRFIMLKELTDQTRQLELRVVLNWDEEVKRRLAAVAK